MTQIKETNNTFSLANIFEERAEHLSKQELIEWSVETPQDRNTIKKLQGTGAKLLIGPRGSGKSTLLRKAYFNLLDAGEILPAYINYSQSLALEPLFHNYANALQIFRQWVLFKIVLGIADAFKEAQKAVPENLENAAKIANDFLDELERGNEPNLENAIALSPLKHLINGWTSHNGFRRCVLLLDDAAHAFSSMQQKEFFEIFRTLKSRTISPKAAVYPGMTSYSPHFHLGHDAQLIEAWYKPEEEGYLDTMRELIKKRLPPEQVTDLLKKQELVDYLAVASFGMPRYFLTMISQMLGIEEDSPNKLSRGLARKAVVSHCSFIRGIFKKLSEKLPRYSHFVEMGSELEVAIIKELKKHNKSCSLKQKTVVVGIAEPIESELDKILELLAYAGIVRFIDTVSWDNNQSYRKYSVHYALLIEKNALSLERHYPLSKYITTLTKREHQNFLQRSGTQLLGNGFQKKCFLNLAPCKNCDAPRAYDEAKFCVECGRRLSNVSIYEELLKCSVDKLPLPNKKIALLKHSSIKMVQDILIDDENQQLRKIKGIGSVWASRIRNAAEEFVSV
jgi:hypothetical protein